MIGIGLSLLQLSVIFANSIVNEQEQHPAQQEDVKGCVPPGPVCNPLYEPGTLAPSPIDYIDFLGAPIVMGDGAFEYNWYETFTGLQLTTEGLFTGTTASPIMIISNEVLPVPLTGEIQGAVRFSYSSELTSGTITSPLGTDEDPFYGCAFWGLVDVTDGWQFALISTKRKVYAWYARTQTLLTVTENWKIFSFLIPIANRPANEAPGTSPLFSIVLNAAKKTASWRVDGEERLLINPTGRLIDPRFLVNCASGIREGEVFPRNLQILAGALSLGSIASGQPHGACQRTLFNECTQSPFNAFQTFCQYAAIQDPESYNMTLNAQFYNWSLVYWRRALDCRQPEEVCEQPNLYCPEPDCGCAVPKPDPCSTTTEESSSSSSSSDDACPYLNRCCGRRHH